MLQTTSRDAQAPPGAQPSLASWYAPGLSDRLGDRLLMFDNSAAPSLELLRFRPDFADRPQFEAALREQVQRLSRFDIRPSHVSVRSSASNLTATWPWSRTTPRASGCPRSCTALMDRRSPRR